MATATPMPELLPPALILLTGAFLIGPARGHWRTAVVLIAPLATLWAVLWARRP